MLRIIASEDMKVLWVSRHRILGSQRRELQSLYGKDIEIHSYSKVFKSAKEIADYYNRKGFDDIVIVAPLSVIQRMCELGIKPLWAEMHKGRFIEFRRIESIDVKYKEVK